MYKRIRNMGIREKLIVSMIFLATLSIVYMGISSYMLAMDRVRSISLQLSEQYTSATGKSIAEFAGGLQELSTEFMRSEELRDFSDAKSRSEVTETRKELEKLVLEQLHRSQGESKGFRKISAFNFIHVYLKNGNSSKNNVDALTFDTYESCFSYFSKENEELNANYSAPLWTSYRGEENGKDYMIYIRFLYEPFTLEKIGIVLFGIEEECFCNLYEEFTSGGFILREDGKILSYANEGNAFNLKKNIKQIMSSRSTLNNQIYGLTYTDENGAECIFSIYPLTGMKSYLVVPFEFYEVIKSQEIKAFSSKVLVMGLLDVVLIVLLSLWISRKMTSSISALVEFVKGMNSDTIEQRYNVNSQDEIGVLGEKINVMLDKIRETNDLKEEKIKEKQDIEIELLQQEINPHLLYNTLESLLYVMEEERLQEAIELTYVLGDFFKISLSRGSRQITLAKELDLIRNYLEIQRYARRKDFKLECEVPKVLLDQLIMKLTLQPLVENSVIHGFSGFSDSGIIRIVGNVEGSNMILTISDDGIGISEKEAEKINEVLALQKKPEDFRHFGLFNIQRRIRCAHGEEYGIFISGKQCVGTTVTIKLPIIERKERDETCLML